MLNSIQDETGELPEDLPRNVTPEVAAAHPDVQNIIAPRLTMLMEIANSFLLTIMNGIESVPYGIRWICKQIRSLTRVRLSRPSVLHTVLTALGPTPPQRKYPEATDYAICSLIGGFFFLRFINPAIVTPQAYMLIDTLPASAKHPRRTLTLVRILPIFTCPASFTDLKDARRSPRCCRTLQTSRRTRKRPT